ncbi:GGDEF domain-containing protein [Oceanimonas sp. MB9]|uniref:sensor domain-containing diguanylate cyclase n=1 Tax=Oceanimonas sp. MB9 TaxID=2588453 RepID=UPI0013F65B9A|nr:GGDEF domain-containing protein [Oceanimonas sp. MB9]NHI01322.1 putative diguanylate cyclase AdrA [Oceanimonas sp. MB9]
MPQHEHGPQDFHWMMDMLESVDLGLVVLDLEFRIELWNGFMENHSGLGAGQALGKSLFQLFPELPEQWLRRKVDTVVTLNTRAFTCWEQRPRLFRFHSTRPVTGTHEYMFQNLTLHPLADADGQIRRVCLMIHDVTDVAAGKLALEQANERLAHLSMTDPLTGLLNRGSWEGLLHAEYSRYRRYRHACSLVMVDIDNFKLLNDTHGHLPGDDVLRHLSGLIRHTLRDADMAGRYGGEEFGIILPHTDVDGAAVICERLRRSVDEARVGTHGQQLEYTISLGVAQLTPSFESALDWLQRADEALYRAKAEGRNRVCFDQPTARIS